MHDAVSAAQGKSVTTIEGLGTPEKPHPVQAAFIAEQAAQCGYCTNGMVMSAAVAARGESQADARCRRKQALAGNLCRCGSHTRVLRRDARIRGGAGMNAITDALDISLSRRALLKAGGALIVGLAFALRGLAQRHPDAGAAPRTPLDPSEVDSFFAVHGRLGDAVLRQGRSGHRAAHRDPQMAAEELGVALERITLVEGDTALTPDQGSTGGSTGVMRGGVQIRQAAATAREALIAMAAQQLGVPAADLFAIDGTVRPKAGGAGLNYRRADRRQALRPEARSEGAAQGSRHLHHRRQVAAASRHAGEERRAAHLYVQDFTLPGMLHGRVIRPPAVGAKLVAVDEASIRAIPGARVVRIDDFLGVVAPRRMGRGVARRAR